MDFCHPLLEGLNGIMLSPARGLLVYCPVALIAIPGLVLAFRNTTIHNSIYLVFVVFIFSSIVFVSKWGMWHGGYCYGPRLLSEIQPFLLLSAIPAWDFVKLHQQRRRLKTLFYTLLAWSIFTQAVGAYEYRYSKWNDFPSDVDRHHDRLWDWRDNPINRSILQGIQPRRKPGESNRLL